MQSLRRMRRLSLAASALRLSVRVQAAAGGGRTHAYRQDRAAGDFTHHRLAGAVRVPQQAGVHVLGQAVAHVRGARGASQVGDADARGAGRGFPHSGRLRQSARHRPLLSAGRFLEPAAPLHQGIRHQPRPHVLRPARERRPAAHADGAHGVDGREDGGDGFRRGQSRGYPRGARRGQGGNHAPRGDRCAPSSRS